MYDRILVPVDGSEHADRALDHARDLARQVSASIDVLYVADDRMPGLVNEYVDMSHHVGDSALDQLQQAGRQILEESVEGARLDESDVEYRTEIVSGNPAASIAEYAEKQGVDLIVMGSHGRTGVDHLLAGSVSENVMRSASVPVLILRGE